MGLQPPPDTRSAPRAVRWDGTSWHDSKADPYYRSSRRGLLHRAVYQRFHGPIPDGYEVHHRDHDKRNNDPGNLIALDPATHWDEHHAERGADWHSKGGRSLWDAKQPITATCKQCGQQFETRSQKPAELCSSLCRERWFAATKTGRSYEGRVCAVCGGDFQARTGAPTETCSRTCTARLAYSRRGPRL